VTDQGPGLSPEIQSRLFQKFSQGSDRGKGIGLGLYISREIIERHHGSIWVESTPGRGATFSFRIPAAL
jgi:signal transduction histidine kinase